MFTIKEPKIFFHDSYIILLILLLVLIDWPPYYVYGWWRKYGIFIFLSVDCPANSGQAYYCNPTSACPRTCDNSQGSSACDIENEPGCRCPDDEILDDNGVCQLRDTCQCLDSTNTIRDVSKNTCKLHSIYVDGVFIDMQQGASKCACMYIIVHSKKLTYTYSPTLP